MGNIMNWWKTSTIINGKLPTINGKLQQLMENLVNY